MVLYLTSLVSFETVSGVDIMANELVPIVLSWGPLLIRKSLEFKCDNSSLVAAIYKGSLKEPMVMHLL